MTNLFRLPTAINSELAVSEINQKVRRREIVLDWSRVEECERCQLLILLREMDLADDSDVLGLETIPEGIASTIESVFAQIEKAGDTPKKKEARKSGNEPQVWQTPDPKDLPSPKHTSRKTAPPKPPPKPLLTPPPPADIRAELEQMLRRDLLGPAGGPEEEIDEPKVSERYIVGMLAPKRQRVHPEEHDDSGVEIGPNTEDGAPELQTPGTPTMFPSSIGFTFAVAGDAINLKVTANWGNYHRTKSKNIVTKTGAPKTVWKRTQIDGVWETPTLIPGKLERWIPCPEQPQVYVECIVRKYQDDGDFMITLFLVNGQDEPDTNRDSAWLYQPELRVECPKNHAVFCNRPMQQSLSKLDSLTAAERDAMDMLYRHQVEFAVGHGVAVNAQVSPDDKTRATSIRTEILPAYEVAAQEPPTAKDFPKLKGLVLDMKELAETSQDQLVSKLEALPKAYQAWIKNERQRVTSGEDGLDIHQNAGSAALDNCDQALRRIREGIALLADNPQAAEAFCFANRAMWLQRVHSIVAEQRRRGGRPKLEDIDCPKNRTWRTFQLAYVLLNLPSITDLGHPDRIHPTKALADLLWFPTGGGKTEAYLGLAAYTMGLRRLQGVVEGHSGETGLAVLMRYTLRLLTLQQFQRATALICACETIRREAVDNNNARWGNEPFRIGLWVGRRATPNTTEQAAESLKQHRGQYHRGSQIGGVGTPAQLKHCPWCGTLIEPGKHIKVSPYSKGKGRTITYCGDKMGRCSFTARRAPDEGIPVVVVDEEIYRRLPTLVIATVDKFAQLPWKGATQMLFGRVNKHCPRHGYRSPEIKDTDNHKKESQLPAVKSAPVAPLRPPDLIIQDELHLISGPLGTMVGLYETAIDELCTWKVAGKKVRPKVLASTATIRRAPEQVHNLFLRQVAVFPPHGTTVSDSFFSLQRPLDKLPGRRYLGICAPGRRLKAVQIRIYVAALAAAQSLYEKWGEAVDPWMTLVGYFNSMRELAGSRRLMEDDVQSRLRSADRRGLAKRRKPIIEELTSRKGSAEIPAILDRLEAKFDPALEEEEQKASRKDRRQTRRRAGQRPLDVVLATNMISVGVDVKRLGLMAVLGQPKTTAEYIQATSRVGRTQQGPGLVCTMYNWARPRDLSHYETFGHYHACFYKHVEALSVTPFAARAVDRGLTALFVSLVRLAEETFNANEMAQVIEAHHALINDAISRIKERAKSVTDSNKVADEVEKLLKVRLDRWLAEAAKQVGSKLGYKEKRDGTTRGLLKPALGERWDELTCMNSLRDVEPTVGLILEDGALDDAGNQGGQNG